MPRQTEHSEERVSLVEAALEYHLLMVTSLEQELIRLKEEKEEDRRRYEYAIGRTVSDANTKSVPTERFRLLPNNSGEQSVPSIRVEKTRLVSQVSAGAD